MIRKWMRQRREKLDAVTQALYLLERLEREEIDSLGVTASGSEIADVMAHYRKLRLMLVSR